MMKIVLLFAALLSSASAFASDVDWQAAEGGGFFNARPAYAGCAKLTLPAEIAKKIAVLRAAANNARVHNLSVSGSEQLESSSGTSKLKYTIVESADAVLRSYTVLYEEVVAADGDSSLCVLIAGS